MNDEYEDERLMGSFSEGPQNDGNDTICFVVADTATLYSSFILHHS